MTDFADWPDAARAVGDLLAPLVAAGSVGGETPAALQSLVPFIRVTQSSSTDDGVTERAHLTVAVFAADATAARALAGQVRQTLIRPVSQGGPGRGTAHGRLDLITADSGPVLLPPTDSDNLRQAVAGYTVTSRKESA